MFGCHIESRRVIPDQPSSGEYRGMHASLAVHFDGYRAWGYGPTKSDADKQAVDKALGIHDSDLCEKIGEQSVFRDGDFEFGNEIERRNEDVFAVCWLWVTDDEAGVEADGDLPEVELEARYRDAAFAPLGDVEGTVSVGDDPGAYVKVLVAVNDLDFDEGDDDD